MVGQYSGEGAPRKYHVSCLTMLFGYGCNATKAEPAKQKPFLFFNFENFLAKSRQWQSGRKKSQQNHEQ
jgi:hypothetical protein